MYTQLSGAHQIHNLVSFADPILPEYSFNENRIDNHVKVYSNRDMVQSHAGTQLTLSGLIGAALFGERGGKLGDRMDVFEFGWAGRQASGTNDIDVTGDTSWWRPIAAHSSPLGNPNVWEKIGKKIK